MSTAARPTFTPAVGRPSSSGMRTTLVSGKDQNAHTKLKFRQPGQSTIDEIKSKDMKAELQKQESKFKSNVFGGENLLLIEKEEKKIDTTLLLMNKPEIVPEILNKYDDADAPIGNSGDEFDSSSSESDDDEDDEEELQAELERIRQERALAQAKKEQEEKELEEKAQRDSALKSDPSLIIDENSAKIKRRWNDDVVFRNQARDEPTIKKRFINDTIRSDFHRSFLKRFMK
eukprot:gene4084-5832_t